MSNEPLAFSLTRLKRLKADSSQLIAFLFGTFGGIIL